MPGSMFCNAEGPTVYTDQSEPRMQYTAAAFFCDCSVEQRERHVQVDWGCTNSCSGGYANYKLCSVVPGSMFCNAENSIELCVSL